MGVFDYKPILNAITPSDDELAHIKEATDKIVTALQASSCEVEFSVVPGGSAAKGTNLKGSSDVDIFVRFKTSEPNLSDMLELMLGGLATEFGFVLERVHGSRDYFTFVFEGLNFEVVPVKFVQHSGEVENVTDMSPLHVFWVKQHLDDKLSADVRLAKQFCKAIQVYGAESFINGISGHVLEILIVHFGGFEPLLRAASSWSGATVIDVEGAHKDVFSELNQSKLVSPLVVVDPIDVQRNAAAALSQEKYNDFIKYVKKFLEKPSKVFFEIPHFNVDVLLRQKQNNENVFVIEVTPQQGKRDVVITKVLKVFEFLHRHLQLYDFSVRIANWFPDEHQCFMYFFIDKSELPKLIERQGPPLENFQGVERFKEVHGTDVYEKNDRLYVKVRRDFTEAKNCFVHLMSQPFVTERVSDAKMNLYQ